jgi:hypothetical protein
MSSFLYAPAAPAEAASDHAKESQFITYPLKEP